jgi:hypothetical protein
MVDEMSVVRGELQEVCLDVSRRISSGAMESALAIAKNRWPNKPVYFLTDSELPASGVVKIKSLDSVGIQGNVFLCAFFSDEKANQVLKRIKDGGGFFLTPQQFSPTAHFLHKNELARNTILDEFRRCEDEGICHFSWRDLANIIQAIHITREVPGDYVEIGVYRGTSARVALNYIVSAGLSRRCYLIDTFLGFSYRTAETSSDGGWLDTHNDTSLDEVAARLREYDGRLEYHLEAIDICEGPLPPDIQSIASCNIDVDMYDAVKAALEKVAPLVSNRGIVIVEDPGHTPALGGAQLALNEFLETPLGHAFVPVYLESGQYYLLKAME